MKRIDFADENRLFKSGNGARATHEADLPELGVRILGDFARIVAAEARLVETTFIGIAQAFVDRLYITSIVMVLALAGVIAVVGSIVALLHQWLPWWQVLGVVGVASLILAAILKHTLMSADVPFYELPPAHDHN
jgi:fatty acid desaturase